MVADEVRNLAQRSAQAAKETASKIEDSIHKSEQGVRISGKVAKGLQEIVAKARQVDELVGEIATASNEQSQGIGQVNIAVGQMDKVTQSSAASAEETASAAGELTAQARTLQDAVGNLTQLVGGKEREAEAPGNRASESDPSTGIPRQRAFVKLPRRDAPSIPVEPAARSTASLPMPVDAGPSDRIHTVPTGDTLTPVTRNGSKSAPGGNGGSPSKKLIEWDEARMTTSVDSVDSQHRELFDRINQLHAACQSGTGKDELLKMLSFLGDYAKTHFQHEEGVMKQHRCPSFGKNKIAHAQFLRDFGQLYEMVAQEGATTRAVLQLQKMLGDWLRNHVCTVDTGLRQCASLSKDALASKRGQALTNQF